MEILRAEDEFVCQNTCKLKKSFSDSLGQEKLLSSHTEKHAYFKLVGASFFIQASD